MEEIDVAIIGAGVIGLAIASYSARKGRSVFIFEKNDSCGQETSSRNSEVIHAGIYYPAGSLKAHTCVEGRHLLYDFCEAYHIPYQRCGKLIVARDVTECAHLEELLHKGNTNGVDDLCLIDQQQLHTLQPHVCGIRALYSPSTGIFDTHHFMHTLLGKAKEQDADIIYRAQVCAIEKKTQGYCVSYGNSQGKKESFIARIVINAAGLHADTVAAYPGINCDDANYRLWYCKGEYFRVSTGKGTGITHLIYPPPSAVSLGIHITPDLGGGLRIGPNAFYIDRGPIDYTVAEDHKEAFLNAARTLLPNLNDEDIFPDTAGIRPKLQGPDDPVKDFVIAHEEQLGFPGFINVLGIESPGLTASLAIGKRVARIVNALL